MLVFFNNQNPWQWIIYVRKSHDWTSLALKLWYFTVMNTLSWSWILLTWIIHVMGFQCWKFQKNARNGPSALKKKIVLHDRISMTVITVMDCWFWNNVLTQKKPIKKFFFWLYSKKDLFLKKKLEIRQPASQYLLTLKSYPTIKIFCHWPS